MKLTQQHWEDKRGHKKIAIKESYDKSNRLEGKMKKLDASYPLSRDTMSCQPTTLIDDDGNEEVQVVNFVYEQVIFAHADEEAPKNIREALYGTDKEQWVTSMVLESINFIKRKCKGEENDLEENDLDHSQKENYEIDMSF
jgi:hypothetical protein